MIVKIKIVGTSHVSTKSHILIKKAINELNPDVIAVESKYGKITVKKLSIFQKICNELESAQQNIGMENTKIKRNQCDMRYSINEAKKRKIPSIEIDMDGVILLEKEDKIPLKEKIILVIGLFRGLCSTIKDSKSQADEIYLDTEQEDHNRKGLEKYYSVWIDERDKIMANNIKKIALKYKRILVVVGLGHKRGIENNLKNESLFLIN